MKVRVTIDCETASEVYSHMRVALKQIRKSFKKTPIPKRLIVLEDFNCYGEHRVTIKNTGQDESI